MARLDLHRTVRFPQTLVYDLIADIEGYPDFVPGFRAVRTEGYNGDALIVRQTVGMRGVTKTFRTHARFDRPHRITITTHERPFTHLHQVWAFDTDEQDRTRVRLTADYKMADPVLRRLFERVFPRILEKGLDAFIARAETLSRSGTAPPSPPPARS